MNTKIQELTDIIYNEGVAKGQAQADEIVARAKEESERLVAAARKEAEQIMTQAQKECDANADNMRKELGLYATQALEALKSQIANVVTDTIVKDAVKGFTQNESLFGEFILTIAKEWVKRESIVIESAGADAIRAYFENKAKELLDGGVKIDKVNGRAAAFTIGPANGAYKVSFGDEEFENWFKAMLRPQLVQALFE